MTYPWYELSFLLIGFLTGLCVGVVVAIEKNLRRAGTRTQKTRKESTHGR